MMNEDHDFSLTRVKPCAVRTDRRGRSDFP
jgi:hypothetical protein